MKTPYYHFGLCYVAMAYTQNTEKEKRIYDVHATASRAEYRNGINSTG